MKRLTAVFISALMILCLAACGNGTAKTENEKNNGISIVATIFPIYDWVREIMGERIGQNDVSMLLETGVDIHNYQPTADDIMKIASCDLFIYVGGESDGWVEDALSEAINPDMIVINLLEVLGSGVKEEEIVPGMDAEEEEGEEEETEYDEHVWLSLKNARLYAGVIAEAISSIDSEGADEYRRNADAFTDELEALDNRYENAVNSGRLKTRLFADRFPFRYMTDDYGLEYFAAFPGCSAETEASFETIVFLAGKVDELGINTVLTIEGGDGSIARTVVENTISKDQKIAAMDSMQSVTAEDVKNGVKYISVMERNLEILTQALG